MVLIIVRFRQDVLFQHSKFNLRFWPTKRSQKVPVMLFLLPIHDLVGVSTKIVWLTCSVQVLQGVEIGP